MVVSTTHVVSVIMTIGCGVAVVPGLVAIISSLKAADVDEESSGLSIGDDGTNSGKLAMEDDGTDSELVVTGGEVGGTTGAALGAAVGAASATKGQL